MITESQIYGIATPLTVIIAAIVQNLQARKAKRAADIAADKTEIVRLTLLSEARISDASRGRMKEQLGEIHTLVDGRMTAALQKIAELEKRLSDLFPHDQGAKARSDAAREQATNHRSRPNDN